MPSRKDAIPAGGYSICAHGVTSYDPHPCDECAKQASTADAHNDDRWMPEPCNEHRFSSSLTEMAACAACDFRGQAIAEAATILDGHPGLQPWEPPVLAEAMLVAVGTIEKAP